MPTRARERTGRCGGLREVNQNLADGPHRDSPVGIGGLLALDRGIRVRAVPARDQHDTNFERTRLKLIFSLSSAVSARRGSGRWARPRGRRGWPAVAAATGASVDRSCRPPVAARTGLPACSSRVRCLEIQISRYAHRLDFCSRMPTSAVTRAGRGPRRLAAAKADGDPTRAMPLRRVHRDRVEALQAQPGGPMVVMHSRRGVSRAKRERVE